MSNARPYRRADFAPLRDTLYGVGFHWTTWTLPRKGKPQAFEAAVKAFDVSAFAQQVEDTGAGHVLFTATHELHWLPGPDPEVDRIMQGRTCERDLLMEIADALAARGIRFMIYYNHGTHQDQDPEWQAAVGSKLPDRSKYFDNYLRIVRWMGQHYGEKVIAYWFDSGCAFADLPSNPDTPWYDMTVAAKAGYPDRLICYNSGIESLKCYTPYQDYWAGEVARLNYLPRGTRTPAGLPWYAFASWHPHPIWIGCGEWGLHKDSIALDWPAPPVESIADFLRRFRACDGAVTFNLLCYQDGSIYDSDLEVMSHLRAAVGTDRGLLRQVVERAVEPAGAGDASHRV